LGAHRSLAFPHTTSHHIDRVYSRRYTKIMIELELINPSWINEQKDDPHDPCAHGGIRFVVNGLGISDGTEEWTVSAAALYLLRTVFSNHTTEDPVAEGNFLLPCCGFSPYRFNSKYGFILIGCPNGINPEIVHQKKNILISYEGKTETVALAEWAISVLAFVNQVTTFYDSCTPKVTPEEKIDAEGWGAFWLEWQQLKDKAVLVAEQI